MRYIWDDQAVARMVVATETVAMISNVPSCRVDLEVLLIGLWVWGSFPGSKDFIQ